MFVKLNGSAARQIRATQRAPVTPVLKIVHTNLVVPRLCSASA